MRRKSGRRGSVVHLSAQHNNGMHPTADTLLLIYINHVGRRVMPGVSCLS